MPDVEISFLDLARAHARWSDCEFGRIDTGGPGPLGPLNHLKKEVQEAIDDPSDPMEYADLLMLVLDAARRAGVDPKTLLVLFAAKLEICRRREWAEPNADGSVEHVRGGE
ncbi:dATP/dGTP pyrophosphohydrolase domain-containing protein [Roseobacter litoralis]|uniref:dATP/dGTP pyrophosphohydrolase domain-containing protein n=1 Tax=Roseobacter litoralis TaxID=42443 RepID=UPI002494A610|nr:dATP/dGTP pyrophosphohydrolase domain-containing protein [Roseobacter litoralis]